MNHIKNLKSYYLDKLLSHRLREFSEFEHSPSALRSACDFPIRYLEIDTRISKDGEIYLYHDPHSGCDIEGDFRFSETSSEEISKLTFKNNEPLLTLRSALEIFNTLSKKEQLFCIDIKDFGYEEKYLDIARNLDLEHRICFISWMPQTIIRLKELRAKTPLILSCWLIKRLGWFGSLLANRMANKLFRVTNYVFVGKNRLKTLPPFLQHGFQHVYFADELPNFFVKILSESNGGVCVPISAVGIKLVEYCEKNKLKLWIFSVGDIHRFIKYAKRPGVDVVFCDKALSVYNQLNKYAYD